MIGNGSSWQRTAASYLSVYASGILSLGSAGSLLNLQTGWRRLTGAQQIEVLDLDAMDYVGECRRVVQIMGQKLLVATRRGVELIGERLINGQQQYFHFCIAELIGMGVAMRDSMPMGGSRRHCDAGGFDAQLF